MPPTETHTPYVVELGSDNTITLPADIAQAFQPTSRFRILLRKNTVILEQINHPNEHVTVVSDDTLSSTDTETPPVMRYREPHQRINLINVLDRVDATPDDEPPPTMEEINEIVHEVRRQYKQARQNEDSC